MSRYDTLREHLPSLYRPEYDDASRETLPLAPEGVLQLNGVALAPAQRAALGMAVRISLDAETLIKTVTLDGAFVPENNLALEFYELAEDSLYSRPRTVALLRNHTATLPETFSESRFAIALIRPGLLNRYLDAIAAAFDTMNDEMTNVLLSHWFRTSDSALYDPHAVCSRDVNGIPMPRAKDPVLETYPYIFDLARLAALLNLPPWEEPFDLRECVEAYRRRIKRIVKLYQNGLGTVDALRAMIEAQLPPLIVETENPAELAEALEQRDRPFWIEEQVPAVPHMTRIWMPAHASPDNLVGPLMRWSLVNDGAHAVPPTVYITGAPHAIKHVDPTINPLIELFSTGGTLPRVGIAYEGTIPPHETLRLSPAYSSWLCGADGLLYASHTTDPTAPGPWKPLENVPRDPLALVQTADHSLWVAANTRTTGALWRCDGAEWQRVVANLSPIYSLLEMPDEQCLLIGTNSGLRVMALYQPGAANVNSTAIEGSRVHCLVRLQDGRVLAGTASGARQYPDGASITPNDLAVYAIHEDRNGNLFFGIDAGLLLYQPGYDAWYVLVAGRISEDESDWEPVNGANLASEIGTITTLLPRVTAIRRGPDQGLWIGTEHGLARYDAQQVRPGKLTYTTMLDAFPDLIDTQVFAIEVDARGLVWFATARGLLRYDGRQMWQYQENHWQQKGYADSLCGDRKEPVSRGHWCFTTEPEPHWKWRNQDMKDWQRFDEGLRSTSEPAVRRLIWVDEVRGSIGTWDETTFTEKAPVDPKHLRMRFKPDALTVLEGGVPALPRLPVGESTWRYLSMETGDEKFPAGPFWTPEGRFIPSEKLPREDTVFEGRFDAAHPWRFDVDRDMQEAHVYSYYPSTLGVWFEWFTRAPMTVLARLKQRSADDIIDPAIIDRVRQGIDRVRPAAVRVQLMVEEEVVGD